MWFNLGKLGMDQPQDPKEQFLGVYTKESKSCYILIDALFKLVRNIK